MPAERHRIASVDDEIQHDLFDHAGIGAHIGRPRRIVKLDVNVLAENPVQHPRQVTDDDVHVDVFDLNRLTAAEREQLARQRCRALGVLRNIRNRLVEIGRQSSVLGGFFGAAENHRQDVVEVMSDSAGELPDRLQLLRLPQLHLEPPSLDLRDDRRQQVGDRQGIGLLVGHPPARRSLVVTGQHADGHPG